METTPNAMSFPSHLFIHYVAQESIILAAKSRTLASNPSDYLKNRAFGDECFSK